MNVTTAIKDGTYFLHPEGGAWIAVCVRNGHVTLMTEESMSSTHAAANDHWAGVVPSEEDSEVSAEEAAAIVRLAMGEETSAELVVVTRPC